jgi:hypothetical protein
MNDLIMIDAEKRPQSLSGPRPRHSRHGLMEVQRRRGRHEKVLRQAVIGMIAGARLGEHENPGEAQA